MKLAVWETALFPMLAALTFALQVALEFLPNIHLTGMFIMIFAASFGIKGLIPLYLYVFLIGIRWGFGIAWIPYLYVWLPLFFAVYFLPKGLSHKRRAFCYPLIGVCHGLLFGVIYSPLQAILFGLNFSQTLAWIAAGIPFDLLHAAGNLAACSLVLPLSELIRRLLKKNS